MSCLTIEAHDEKYRINDPGGIIGNCLKAGKPYELKALEHMYRAQCTGTAVDVGAGVGNHTLWLAAVCKMPVMSFEPLDWKRLQENVDLNPELPIYISACGLGDENKSGSVNYAPEHVTGRALSDDDLVPIATLDSHPLPEISLIKIDVEGMEPEVLRGASETIDYFHPILYVEAIDGKSHDRNAAEIPKGYRHTHTFGATPLEVWQWQV